MTMTTPNLIRNASLLAVLSSMTSNLMQVAYRTEDGQKAFTAIEQRPGVELQNECRAQFAQNPDRAPVLDLLLTDYGTVATFAAPGELTDEQAQAILAYVG